jgi:uncharacterized protein with PIN domain
LQFLKYLLILKIVHFKNFWRRKKMGDKFERCPESNCQGELKTIGVDRKGIVLRKGVILKGCENCRRVYWEDGGV